MRYYILLLFICLCSTGSFSQSVSTLMGARAAGMGYASSGLHDEWSLWNNVGGIASVKNTTLAAAYDAKPGLQGANRAAFAGNVPTKFGTAAVGFFRFGDDLYSEQIASAGFGNKFGIASLGAKVSYIQYNALGFGTRGVATVSFGGIAELTKQISIGAHVQNINRPKVTEATEEKVPTLLTAGIGITPTEKVTIISEIQKDLDYDATFRTGIEYQYSEKFSARTGFNLKPSSLFIGVGFKNTKLFIDYAFQYVPAGVGSGHQASVGYKIQKK